MKIKETTGSERLIKDIAESIPAILSPSCDEGMFRLRMLARGDYVACGYYYGVVDKQMAMYTVDGQLSKAHRANMKRVIDKTAPEDDQLCGFWFVKLSVEQDEDEDLLGDDISIKTYAYCHYHITL